MKEVMQWLGEPQNAAAIQTLNAIIVTILTVALIVITGVYAQLTKRTMERQMVAGFHPNVQMALTFHGTGSGSHFGVRSFSIAGNLAVVNKGDFPVKISSLNVDVVFPAGQFLTINEVIDTERLVISPSGTKEFDFMVDVPEGAQDAEHDRRVTLHCSDLSGFSKHSFTISDRRKDLSHELQGG